VVRQSSRALLVALLAPALLGLLIFRLYPIAIAVISSFYTTVHGNLAFIGLGNYESLIDDHVFWRSLGVTLWFNLLVNPIQIAISLALALLYVRKFPGARVYRVFFLIPIGVSVPVAVIVWRVMLTQGGLANGLLNLIGVAPQPWLTSSRLALYSIIAITTWKGASYWMIFIVGGLQNISPELYDAARVDGVRPWRRFVFITLPLLRPALLFVLAADVSINFLLFAPIYMLTQGGPAGSTDVLMYEAYKQGFIFGDMGRAMAMVVVIVAILLVVVGLQFRLLSAREQGA